MAQLLMDGTSLLLFKPSGSSNKMLEAVQRYGPEDKGVLDASDALTNLILQLHQSPYNAALPNLGTKTEQLCGDNSQT